MNTCVVAIDCSKLPRDTTSLSARWSICLAALVLSEKRLATWGKHPTEVGNYNYMIWSEQSERKDSSRGCRGVTEGLPTEETKLRQMRGSDTQIAVRISVTSNSENISLTRPHGKRLLGDTPEGDDLHRAMITWLASRQEETLPNARSLRDARERRDASNI